MLARYRMWPAEPSFAARLSFLLGRAFDMLKPMKTSPSVARGAVENGFTSIPLFAV